MNWKKLIICILIPIGVGFLCSIFIDMNSFDALEKPFDIPKIIFPIVWSILYLLMGISSYLVLMSKNIFKDEALLVYGVQLIVNLIWPFIFFNMGAFLFAFIWLILLIFLVIVMIIKFYSVDKRAAYLQIPYLLWLFFAGYLNFMIYYLN